MQVELLVPQRKLDRDGQRGSLMVKQCSKCTLHQIHRSHQTRTTKPLTKITTSHGQAIQLIHFDHPLL